MSRVLVISDLHLPSEHQNALWFVKDLRDKHKCDKILSLGDIVDWGSITFHAKNPNLPGPKDEYELTKKSLHPWKAAFPKMFVCVGNHDARPRRIAENAGIPGEFLKPEREVWETSGWTWADRWTIDDVVYFHGVGCGGVHPAWTAMNKTHQNTVIGHVHSCSGIKWLANENCRHFAMDAGCLIDHESFAFVYGAHLIKKPILSAAVVLDGTPIHYIMECGPGERYHKKRR